MSHVTRMGRRELSPKGNFGSFPNGLFRKQSSILHFRVCVPNSCYIALHLFDNTYFVRVASVYSRPSEAPTSPSWLTTLSTRRAPIWPT
jgi:hypothetical protein